MPKKILFDTDPGIDDACAILLALASPELSLEGLSVVHGNCSLEQGTINALSVLELAHAGHIPVAKGCELPLLQPSLLAPETHGDTGLGYAKPPARDRFSDRNDSCVAGRNHPPGDRPADECRAGATSGTAHCRSA